MRFIHTAILTAALTALAAMPAFADGSFNGTLLDMLRDKGVIDEASYKEVKDAQAGGGKDANQALADVLYRKGVIDDPSYRMLSEKAASEKAAAVNTDPRSSAAQPKAAAAGDGSRPLEDVLASAEEGFARLTGDRVKLRIGSWLQLGWLNDDSGSSTYYPGVANAFSPTSGNGFHAKYARLYFNGKLDEKIGFRVMFDAAPTSSTVFRDAFVYFDHIPYARVTLGQYLTPFGDEVWRAPFETPTINYSMASTFIQLPTSRSLGVMLSGKYMDKTGSGLPYGAGYAVSAINGIAAGTPAGTDDNDYKDLIGRVYVTPFVPGLSVGGSFYTGKTRHVVGGVETDRDHDRWAAEFDYAPEFAKGLTLRGEYLWQSRFFTNGGLNRQAHSEGWYMTGAYRFGEDMGYLRHFEPLVRYERFDEDTAVAGNERGKTTAGLNYYFNKYTRLMVNYEVVDADGRLGAFTLQGSDNSNVDHSVFTTAIQVWF